MGAAPAERPAGHLRAYLIALVVALLLVSGSGLSDERPVGCRRSGAGRRRSRTLPAAVGLTQQAKARLQGRRGAGAAAAVPGAAPPWGKSGVDVEGTTLVYRLAPLLAAAAMGTAILLVPAASAAPGLGVGHDALALAGLLALARLAVCAAPGTPPTASRCRVRAAT